MAETYKWLNGNTRVKRGSDGASIPDDPGNKDWKEYQAWATAGGVTTAADSLPTAAAILSDERAAAITELLSDTSPNAKFIRAVLLVILDEINVIRALLPGPPAARTIAQLKTAVQNKINAGTAD